MYNRYLILSPFLATAALHCQVETATIAEADPVILKALFSEGVIAEEGDDAELRPRFVGTQAAFERHFAEELESGAIKQLMVVIHTALPATPVCTENTARSHTVRSLLQNGGTLLIAYPAVARQQRSETELAIFDELREKYPDRLLDVPMGCLEVALEMSGATYLYETDDGEWYTLSICFTQTAASSAAMWFGDAKEGVAAERLAQVAAYLRACQGPDFSIPK